MLKALIVSFWLLCSYSPLLMAEQENLGTQQAGTIEAKGDPQDELVKQFARQSNLFFFYTSNCPYCHKFAPILKSFVDSYKINLVPITQNGIMLSAFPDSKIDNGLQSAMFHVRGVPALFALDPNTHEVILVGYGFMTEKDLKNRIANTALQF